MNSVQVDIVSDVVCPWCIVGLKQLEEAAHTVEIEIDIRWHPFELNPQMPEVGQNLQEHICEKYGTTVEQSKDNRQRLTDVGTTLGIAFNFHAESRMVNTFKAHQLLHWARSFNQEHQLKTALFTTYFTDQKNISSASVLLEVVESIGLDSHLASVVLEENQYHDEVRDEQQYWIKQGISGVPAMVFNEKYLVTGAQGTQNYQQILTQLAAKEG